MYGALLPRGCNVFFTQTSLRSHDVAETPTAHRSSVRRISAFYGSFCLSRGQPVIHGPATGASTRPVWSIWVPQFEDLWQLPCPHDAGASIDSLPRGTCMGCYPQSSRSQVNLLVMNNDYATEIRGLHATLRKFPKRR